MVGRQIILTMDDEESALMRGPISEAIIIVTLGFFIGGIAGQSFISRFENGNAIAPLPVSRHAPALVH
jgi:K+-transporting ATPase A subunit